MAKKKNNQVLIFRATHTLKASYNHGFFFSAKINLVFLSYSPYLTLLSPIAFICEMEIKNKLSTFDFLFHSLMTEWGHLFTCNTVWTKQIRSIIIVIINVTMLTRQREGACRVVCLEWEGRWTECGLWKPCVKLTELRSNTSPGHWWLWTCMFCIAIWKT